MINELRWQLHDLWPDWKIPKRVLIHPGWQTKIARRLSRATKTVQVQIARDMITRVRELTRTITELYEQLAALVRAGRAAAAGREGSRRVDRGEADR